MQFNKEDYECDPAIKLMMEAGELKNEILQGLHDDEDRKASRPPSRVTAIVRFERPDLPEGSKIIDVRLPQKK